ncbi:MAG: HAD family phosphatase [Clostridia bacterium]|nr:HAD family phosphatase [Clostridia bacterium]
MTMRGAIFDMDGTLIDSMGGWATVGQRYLQSRGITPAYGERDSLMLQGWGSAVRHYQAAYGIEDGAETIERDIKAMMADYYRTEPVLRAGVLDFLTQLRASGVRICVATATDRALAAPVLERLGIAPFVEKLFVCGELNTTKHKPLIYDTAREWMGTPLECTWVFEDAWYAARTAKAAGYRVCGIADWYEPQERELRALCDLFAETYRDITPFPF